MPSEYRYVFEFRDTSWFCDDVYKILADANCGYCIYELDGLLTPEIVTADFVYIRLHGPNGKYEGSYSDRELKKWAGKISSWHSDKKEIYCYFDNDRNGYAVYNALKLQNILHIR